MHPDFLYNLSRAGKGPVLTMGRRFLIICGALVVGKKGLFSLLVYRGKWFVYNNIPIHKAQKFTRFKKKWRTGLPDRYGYLVFIDKLAFEDSAAFCQPASREQVKFLSKVLGLYDSSAWNEQDTQKFIEAAKLADIAKEIKPKINPK